MHHLIREVGSFGANPGAKDLARHLYTRMWSGAIVIVADKPLALISPVRKQWLKLARKVQRERAGTMNAARIKELTDITMRMHNLRFLPKWSEDVEAADVYLATVEQLLAWPPECSTMYITGDVELEKLYMITAWMPQGSLIVICRIA